MTKKQVNEVLKQRIGFSSCKDAERYRKIYKEIIDEQDQTEKDFYYSVLCWFNDGNAPYYDSYLKKIWK